MFYGQDYSLGLDWFAFGFHMNLSDDIKNLTNQLMETPIVDLSVDWYNPSPAKFHNFSFNGHGVTISVLPKKGCQNMPIEIVLTGQYFKYNSEKFSDLWDYVRKNYDTQVFRSDARCDIHVGDLLDYKIKSVDRLETLHRYSEDKVYTGSSSGRSETVIRLYDKNIEQKSKLQDFKPDYEKWFRFEVQLRGKTCHNNCTLDLSYWDMVRRTINYPMDRLYFNRSDNKLHAILTQCKFDRIKFRHTKIIDFKNVFSWNINRYRQAVRRYMDAGCPEMDFGRKIPEDVEEFLQNDVTEQRQDISEIRSSRIHWLDYE